MRLHNRIIPLRLGYVPVVNRGQRDIENNCLGCQTGFRRLQATLPIVSMDFGSSDGTDAAAAAACVPAS